MKLFYAQSKKGTGQFSVNDKALLCNEPSVIKETIISCSTYDVEDFEIVQVDGRLRLCDIIDNSTDEVGKERE